MPGKSGLLSPSLPKESQKAARAAGGRSGIKGALAAARRRFQILMADVESHIFDLRHGTKTAGKAPVEKLDDLVGDNVGHGTGYQPLNGNHFRKVLNSLPLPDDSVLVDVGSGKGKALLIAAQHTAVSRAIGVEFGGALCAAARRNVDTYRPRENIRARIEIHHQDAMLYEIGPDNNVFLLFNPFDRELFSSFVEKIDASIGKHPRRVWLIYGNPRESEILDNHPAFAFQKLHRFYGPGRDMAVYSGGSGRVGKGR